MKNTYYSQFGEDKWLVENKILPTKGFFLDLGAGDWKRFSNTLYFEQHGWDGICIDADPRQLAGLTEHRKQVVCGAIVPKGSDAIGNFYMSYATEDVSGFHKHGREKEVYTATFTVSDLAGKFDLQKIDLLSLDIEGDEPQILGEIFETLPLPEVVITEYVTAEVKNNLEEIKHLVARFPYKLIKKTEANLILKRK